MTYAVDYALVDGDAPPNFVKAKAYAGGSLIVGIRGAWGFRGTASVDPTLQRDAATARATGCQVFGYLFLDYATPVMAQVSDLVNSYQRQPSDLPVMLDLEMDTPPAGTTPASRVAAAEYAMRLLQSKYGDNAVMPYTSLEQWEDHFGDLDSEILGMGPLALKVPYPWNARNPPHLDDVPALGDLPTPWRRKGSPGAWLQQFQGDAIDFPGFTSTVDISKFLTVTDKDDPRWTWIDSLCDGNLAAFQAAHGLTPDEIPGPLTFAALCQ